MPDNLTDLALPGWRVGVLDATPDLRHGLLAVANRRGCSKSVKIMNFLLI